jgi:hypothetical protein
MAKTIKCTYRKHEFCRDKLYEIWLGQLNFIFEISWF